jgi:predicted acyltransferase
MTSILPGTPMPRIELAHQEQAMRMAQRASAPRLVSLDVFRGLVILAMLIVNNLGDGATTGYFWKHADWPAMSQAQAWRAWWGYAVGGKAWTEHAGTLPAERLKIESPLRAKRVQLRAADELGGDKSKKELLAYRVDQLETQLRALDEEQKLAESPWRYIPLFTYCTLADYVMPSFMLIIGVAIPFAVAAARARGTSPRVMWLRTIKRAFMLVLLGWILCYFRDQFAGSLYDDRPWNIHFGMDVLQLLGVGYLVARVLYELPMIGRFVAAVVLFGWHFNVLRFWPQGPVVPAGTFTEHYEAVGYIYAHAAIWERLTLHLPHFTLDWKGLMSVPPAAATMLVGTLMGDLLRRADLQPGAKISQLASWGVFLALLGLVWAIDLPFNKPRWSPTYLVYVCGIDALLIAGLYAIIDIHLVRGWGYPLLVLGTNAIAVYWLSIMAKVLLMNTPRVSDNNFAAHSALAYATMVLLTITLGIVLWRLARAGARQIGPATYALLAMALVPAVIMWIRFLREPAERSTSTAVQSVSSIVIATLKTHLGQWLGGWMFTIAFIAFWWLVLDRMYRRKIFWKL